MIKEFGSIDKKKAAPVAATAAQGQDGVAPKAVEEPTSPNFELVK